MFFLSSNKEKINTLKRVLFEITALFNKKIIRQLYEYYHITTPKI